MQRGFVKRRIGRADEAMEDLKRATSLDAKSREAYNHLGMALLDIGHFEQVHPRKRKCLPRIESACNRRSMLLSAQLIFPTPRLVPI